MSAPGAGGLFGRIAIEKGFCTEAQLSRALRFQEEVRALGLTKPLGEILVGDGVLTADQVQLVVRLQKVNEAVQKNKHFAKVAVRNALTTQAEADAAYETVREGGFKRTLGDVLVERGQITATAERAIRHALDRARHNAKPVSSETAVEGIPVGPATARLGVALELDPEEALEALSVEKRIRDVLFAAVALRDGLVLVPELERAVRDQLGRPGEPLLETVLRERGILSKRELESMTPSIEKARDEKLAIPGYQLVDVLGRGATSIVLRARHELIEREVAIKLFRTEHVASVDADALVEEARAVAKIRHPNVVGLFDVGRVHRRIYFVMELVDGSTLDEAIKRKGPLSEADALARVREVARALGAIQENGIVHRDVKPQNVLLAKDGTAKLTDLGLACEVGGSAPGDTSAAEGGTAIYGSPHFMAPEQVNGDPVDIRTDLYGLGATLYFALTGTPPFEGKDPVGVMMRHVTDPVPDPRAKRPEVREETAALVALLMAKAPGDRPATPGDVVLRIDRLLGEAPGPEAPAETAEAV